MDQKLLQLLDALSSLASAAGIKPSFDRSLVKELKKLSDASREVDEKGRRTRGASEALRKLAHPKGLSTPMARAVPATHKKALERKAKAEASVPKAFADLIAAIMAEAEYQAFQEARPLTTNRKGDLPNTSKDEDVEWFIDWIRRNDVPPYVLRRMPEWMRELLAKLMLDARDKKFERADNLWPKLFRAGVLDAVGCPSSEHLAQFAA